MPRPPEKSEPQVIVGKSEGLLGEFGELRATSIKQAGQDSVYEGGRGCAKTEKYISTQKDVVVCD